MCVILYTKYEEADLHKVMETQYQHLTMTQRNKFEEFFNGKIGTRKTGPLDFELKEDAQPIWLQPYPLLKVHEKLFKKEVGNLVLLGVLNTANNPEWGAPPFAQSKPKSNRVRFISDFRNLNNS